MRATRAETWEVQTGRQPAVADGRRTRLRWVPALVGLYVVVVIAVWATMRLVGDRSWISLPLLYGPRWLLAAPLAALVPLALLARRPVALLALAVAAVIVAVPVMGLQVSTRALAGSDAPRDLRVLTHNLGRVSPGSPRVLELLERERPDVALFQECVPEGEPPALTFPGWFTQHDHQMCVVSRWPIRSVDARDRTDVWKRGGSGAIVLYEIETPAGVVWFLNLHLETPRDGLIALRHGDVGEARDNLAVRAWESDLARGWAERAKGELIIAGDFNMTDESALYRAVWGEFTNAFGAAGLGYGHTKETRWYGARIDHVLLGPGWECTRAWLGPETGSDHVPLVAEMVRQGR